MSQNTVNLSQAIELAAQHLHLGNYDHASEVCAQILQVDQDNADALHFLGLIAANQGRSVEALAYLQRAVCVRDDDFELHNNLGNLYKALGQLQQAQSSYLQSAALNQQCFPAHFNLGLTLAALNRHEEALDSFRRAIELEPQVSAVYYNLALALRQVGETSAALDNLRQAIAFAPDYLEAQVALGDCLAQQGALDAAINAYQAAIALGQDHPAPFNNLGVVLTASGHYLEAQKAFSSALELQSDLLDARNNLGVVERLLGNYSEAIAAFKVVIEAAPQFGEAYRNLGQCLAEQGSYDQAVLAFGQAIKLDPNNYDATLELAICYASMGENQEAVKVFGQAQAMNPDSLVPVWGAVICAIPNFYNREDEITRARSNYTDALSQLESLVDLETPEKIADAVYAIGLLMPFFLTYQNLDNRKLQERYAALITRVLHAGYPQWSKALSLPKLKADQRIRVGIVSRHFSNHSDYKMITAGILNAMDPAVFDVFAYSTGGIADAVTAKVRKQVSSFVWGLNFEQLCERIYNDQLHVLIYPELGIDPITCKIAALRLAPVQCAGWARPETSGFTSVDYFLSGELMEPDGAQAHYTEKLVRLPNLFSYYEPPQLEPDTSRLRQLGVRTDAVRYVCAQSLFKYLPQHDFVLAEIAKNVPQAQFIFVSKPAAAAAKLQARLTKVFDLAGLDATKHITFLPVLSHDEFAGLLKDAHIFLDSIGYSGCLTTLDALEAGLPVVTMNGEFMRGRQSKAMLSLLEISETVAADLNAYVDIAVRLAKDELWRARLTRQIEEKRYFLYRDYEAIQGLQEFLKGLF